IGVDIGGDDVTLQLREGFFGDFNEFGSISFVGGPVTGLRIPSAHDIAVTVSHGTAGPLTIANDASDENPQPVTTVLLDPNNQPVSGPLSTVRGVVTIDPQTNAFIYTSTGPDGVVGPDSFAYKVNNGVFDSTVYHVTIAVADNQPPVAHDGSVMFTHAP